MSPIRLLRWSAALASVLALSTVAAQASHDRGGYDRSPRPDRMLVVTTSQNQLLRLNARNPERIRDIQSITPAPPGADGAARRRCQSNSSLRKLLFFLRPPRWPSSRCSPPPLHDGCFSDRSPP
jgi:hypothetical protein